jgi:hydrophobe/amphiphile efflux-3 (HAE3) family protein
MGKLADGIIRLRWVIIVAFLALTVFFARQLPRLEIEPDVKAVLPEHIESRINTDRIDELFGGTELMMVILQSSDILNPDTLQRTKTLSRRMKRIKGVDKVLSLFELKNIRSEEGAMIVEPAVRRIPRSEEETAEVRQGILDNDLVYGSVVSEDFTLTAVIAMLKTDVSDDFIVREINRLVAENPGPEETFVGGLPPTRVEIGHSIRKDLQRLLPFGILIMLVFLFLCFKQLRGVALPFLVVIMSIIFAMGLIPLFGWKIQMITVVLPVMLIAIANDYGIHLIAKYQEYNTAGNTLSNRDLGRGIFTSLSRPVVLTGITTMAGMLCLLGHIFVPARELSVLAALGILYALSASLLFIPAVISLLPKAKPVLGNQGKKPALLDRMLIHLGPVVTKRPRLIILTAVGSALLISIGIFSVVIDTDPNSYYTEEHPIVQTSNLINHQLGGAQSIALVFEGDIKEPELLQSIDRMEGRLNDIPEVGITTSIARVVRQMSRALHDEDEEGYDRIPDTRNAVAQYFELYSMSGDPEDFEKMVDFPYENALLQARLETSSTKALNRVIAQIAGLVKDNPYVKTIGGFGLILSEMAYEVVKGQFISLALAILVVGVLLMLLFRSIMAGVIAAIPLGLSMTVLFGLMGVFGIELNIATALLSSIMIGVGVDYTIHYLWRFRQERQEGHSALDAAATTLSTTGRGIVFNALSVVVGFAVLLISDFMPVKFFSFLVVVSILSCLMGALVLIPALCLVIKPRFLEPRSTV